MLHDFQLASQFCIALFHDNKGIFVDLDIRQGFNLPKLHFLSHYRRVIELYGITDNYTRTNFRR